MSSAPNTRSSSPSAKGPGHHGLRGRIGLALGSGAARGWAHVGVIDGLLEAGIRPEVVCGASSGAVIGALYAAEALQPFVEWGRQLDWRQLAGYFDLTFRGGLIKARKIFDQVAAHLPDQPIEELGRPFGAVATDLESGREVWLRQGSLLDALRASMALPGLITPAKVGERWLVDGGLVNPVPVSLCRAMGADTVIAVDLNTTLLNRRFQAPEEDSGGEGFFSSPTGQERVPSIYEVIANSVNIMQVRITRSRMAGDPPDLLVVPRLAHFALLDFDRASQAIEEGRRAVARALSSLAVPGSVGLDP